MTVLWQVLTNDWTAGIKIALIFSVGHVDAGKSTLMGHLLYRLGDVSKKSMHKYPFDFKKFILLLSNNL